MKKKGWVSLAAVLLVFWAGAALAQHDFVTASKLSDKEVTKFIELELSKYPGTYLHSGATLKLTQVLGVHQKDNEATVYFQFQWTTENGQGVKTATIQFVRFTSDKWFCPGRNLFLTN